MTNSHFISLVALLSLTVASCATSPKMSTMPDTSDAESTERAAPTQTEEFEMPAIPWSVAFSDGSGNGFRFGHNALAKDPANFEYIPVAAADSSSGTYSGGSANKGEMTDAQAQELWMQVEALRADTEGHVKLRMKGTGTFTLATPDLSAAFIVGPGPGLDAFLEFAAAFRGPQ